MLNVYHSGSFDPSVLEIPLKQIDSITHDDYVLNLHVSTLNPPVYSFVYRKREVFQGNQHVLYFVIERFKEINKFYKQQLSNLQFKQWEALGKNIKLILNECI